MPDEGWSSPYEPQAFAADVYIYRAVHPTEFVDWKAVDENGLPGLQSGAFQVMSEDRAAELGYIVPAMSVAMSHELEARGEGPERVLDEFAPNWGIARILLSEILVPELKLGAKIDPKPGAPWHGLVFGLFRVSFSKGQKRAMRRCATWVQAPAP